MPDTHGCFEHAVYESLTTNDELLTVNLAGDPEEPYGSGVRWWTAPMAIATTEDVGVGSSTSSGATCITGSDHTFIWLYRCACYSTLLSDDSTLEDVPSLATDTFLMEETLVEGSFP